MNEQIKKIVFPIKNELDSFELELKKIVSSNENYLTLELSNFIFSSPKRLRVILVFLFSKILLINSNLVQTIALALELTHSASLVHDDIIDNSNLRRNNPTFYKKFGSKAAVLIGDLFLSLVLEVLAKTNNEILSIFSYRIKKTLSGEIEQSIFSCANKDEEQYFNKTFNKTGNLFLAGLESLFTLKEIDKDKKQALVDFLVNYAIAFQLKNDLLDIESDIKNGNYTLVVLYFLQENSIEDLNSNTNLDKYAKLAVRTIENYRIKALEKLAVIEDSTYKKSLIELTNLTLGNLWKK